ncbi:hypothetical protein QVH35_10320 [Candidatus Nitrosotenuis chungbukensis]|uniref:hypothetical protein n=1 Tax=Candidatus Nitrosotenuis chungbukensis TaxID=1353246 RepID=UPI0026737BAB|nr:hypothetical protein [Candidatus Nitrosotenuis chungbukensis]WKT57702.1 hypothetical protein QVH35_10320 [Candidatus Nitrosotenuis chungbukensis]
MNKKILYAGIMSAIAIISVLIVSSNDAAPPASVSASQYLEHNLILKQKLSEAEISMSSPIRLQTPDEITQYCSFFADSEKQKLVEYCTSTELKDKDGNFLGNIHMVGLKDVPQMVLVLVQTDPTMSKIDSVKKIFNVVIQELVCKCWADVKPDNFENIDGWVDGMRDFHTSDTQTHSKSKQLVLEGKTLQLEAYDK